MYGIDAPELDPTILVASQGIACGTMSRAALEALTAGVNVRCEVVERDRQGRLVAKCSLPMGGDIGSRLVLAGWAVAYRQYSTDYIDAERKLEFQAGDVAGNVRETADVARIVIAAAHTGVFIEDILGLLENTGSSSWL
jgi:hypothetical protein